MNRCRIVSGATLSGRTDESTRILFEDIHMTTSKARQIVLADRPKGKPRLTDFRLEETLLPTPGGGQLLLEVQYLSLDPYMRGRMDDLKSYAKPLQLGDVMTGETVARVIASNRSEYSEGDIVLAPTGWRTHALSDGAGLRKLDPTFAPVTTGLGVLGMPGFTAYGGLRLIGKPQPGETVVVAAASGPVGSLVGQLAKLARARAVGIAGGAEKCAYVKNELRFDAAIDHRAADFPAQLAAACPKGIDVYFENVGGAIWQAVLPLLNNFARVPVCGLIAQYNGAVPGDGTDHLPSTMREILSKSLTLRGFIYYEFVEKHYAEFLREVGAGIADGSIRYREDIVDGLKKAPEAFIGMLDGRNFGKVIVRVSA
jgi:NADPH-dependent curcumin reductase CurA